MITSDCTFSWFGQPSHPPTPKVRAAMSAAVARQHLLSRLRQRLYSDFYLSGGAVAHRHERTAMPVADVHAFIAGLESANSGAGTWSQGWVEAAQQDDSVVVHHEQLGLSLWVGPDDIRSLGEREVAVRLPAALPAWSPGFWLALGDTPFTERGEQQVRFYWNVRPDGATLLVEQATRLLNEAAIPFRLKLLAEPSRYTRCDAAVLYLPESVVERALPIVQAIYDQVRATLKPAVPALTARLAPGLALADDPDGDESFGSRYCRLLAGAIVAAAEAGVTRLPERVAFVIERLAEHGVDIERPYLRPGRSEPGSAMPSIACTPSTTTTWVRTDRDFLAVAAQLAAQIAADAIWHDEACVWLGMTEQQERGLPVYGTLGPNLYSGSSGIALFLGDVYAATGDAACREAALGGIRYALSHAHEIASPSILGLYTGLPGLALAAVRLADTLRVPTLLDDACALLREIDTVPSLEHDLLSGTAGALLAVLLLHRTTADERWLQSAVRLGDRLLDAAHRGAGCFSWRSGRRALTGLSHGASGIGLALLELAVVTGEVRFAAAANGAFAWERRLFDAEAGNWPDLRRVSGPVSRSTALPYGMSWCHGAPGIVLARLRAADLLADDTLRAEAPVALETTRRWIDDALANGDESFCLCHGLAGNALILHDGGVALGDPALIDAARTVAAAGIEGYAHDPDAWPCGTYSGSTPGLMLGLAGIGHFYLRLANPTLPSVLLPALDIDGQGSRQ